MSSLERWNLWITTILVVVTGVALFGVKYLMAPSEPWAVINHPIQPWLLKAHIIVSPFMTLISPYARFGWTALFQIVLAVFIVYRMRVRDEIPEDQRSDFVDTLNKIQTVLPIPTSTLDQPSPATTDADTE